MIRPFDDSVGIAVAQREAAKEREAFGAFNCPICGHDSPHPHSEEEVARWVEAQIGRFNLPGWVLVKGGDHPCAPSRCPHCRTTPRATGERDTGLWSYVVRCEADHYGTTCMVRPSVWAPTSAAALAKWEAMVSAARSESVRGGENG